MSRIRNSSYLYSDNPVIITPSMEAIDENSLHVPHVQFSPPTDDEDDPPSISVTASSSGVDNLASEQIPRRSQQHRGSFLPDLKPFSKRASQLIVDVPVAQLRKIKNTEGVSSITRETEHFANTTTLHGPKRVYNGKRWSTIFWILIVSSSMLFLLAQVISLIQMFFSKPTVSQVSFLISEGGMTFPKVTVCSFNPIKRSYVKTLNSTGDLSDDLLEYLMMFNSDAMTLYGRADGQRLHSGEKLFNKYVEKHPNFTADGFFEDAGFECPDMFKMCTFGGRRFDCCKYAHPVYSDLGKCFTLNIQHSEKPWMKTQSEPGIAAGLQIILDSHLDEQFADDSDTGTPVFSSAFENGFRYYIHSSDVVPFLSSEGIAVSPDTVVYSALSSSRYLLLPKSAWGNCSNEWPNQYDYDVPYSAAMCSTVCKSLYFNVTCGCSPSIYNLDNRYRDCTPYETYRCMDTTMKNVTNNIVDIKMPRCEECRMECNSQVYQTYNSYGRGFSQGALRWLDKQGNWGIAYMKKNFQVLNVFFRDMSYTEYIQVQGMSITELLSDIGGNMGMFLGMSVITIIEVSLYLSKVGWIAMSRKRRDYMYSKKKNEEQHEKELEDVVTGFKLFRSRKTANDMTHLREKIRDLPLHRISTEQLNISKMAWQAEPDINKRIATVTRQGSALRQLDVNRNRALTTF